MWTTAPNSSRRFQCAVPARPACERGSASPCPRRGKAGSPSPPALPDAPAQRLRCGQGGGASREWSGGASQHLSLQPVAASPRRHQRGSSAVAVGPAGTTLGTHGRLEPAAGGEAGRLTGSGAGRGSCPCCPLPAALAGAASARDEIRLFHKPDLRMWGQSSHHRCCHNFVIISTGLFMCLFGLPQVISNKNWTLSRGEEK